MKALVMSVICATLIIVCLLSVGRGYAKIDPDSIIAVWLFDEGRGSTVRDSEGKGIDGTIRGGAKWVDGLRGKALKFDGKDDFVAIPNSPHINSAGPYTNRTIMALFKCDDVSITSRKQVVYEEGGTVRGFCIYFYDGKVYVGGWNRAEYNWPGA